MKIKLARVGISKAQFDSMSDDERVLFVQLGTLHNELDVLLKYMLVANAEAYASSGIEQTSHVCQSWLCVSTLAIKLDAGWQMLRKTYQDTKLSKKYNPLLPETTRKKVKSIMDFFDNRDNCVSKIRNKIAAHYDADVVREQINKLPDDWNDELILSSIVGNCLLALSRTLMIRAALDYADPSSEANAMNKLFDDITSVTGWFLDFTHDCLCALVDRCKLQLFREDVEIPQPPLIKDAELSYFWSEDPKDTIGPV